MTMQNVFSCEGCFFTGKKDGYRPECNCKIKEEFEHEANELPSSFDCDSLYLEEAPSLEKDRYTSFRRRVNRAKSVRKRTQVLPIVQAKSDRLPANASDEQISFLNHKLSNTYESAKFRHQIKLSLSFPEIPGNRYGRHNVHLISTFRRWERNANFKGNSSLATACRNAVEVLELVSRYDGETIALHREETILHVTVGFRDKYSLSNFKEKLAS